jgi:hypothetical protein
LESSGSGCEQVQPCGPERWRLRSRRHVEKAVVSVATLRNYERGVITPVTNTLAVLRRA